MDTPRDKLPPQIDNETYQRIRNELTLLRAEMQQTKKVIQRLEKALAFCKECMNQSHLENDWVKQLEAIENGQ